MQCIIMSIKYFVVLTQFRGGSVLFFCPPPIKIRRIILVPMIVLVTMVGFFLFFFAANRQRGSSFWGRTGIRRPGPSLPRPRPPDHGGGTARHPPDGGPRLGAPGPPPPLWCQRGPSAVVVRSPLRGGGPCLGSWSWRPETQ